MNIDQLTKSQIVLLTLFTSFVTSIATGIVTVTLLQQAPPAITHTISKVVQTTIEKVIEPSKENKIVVVNYEDELANVVTAQEKHLIRIHKPGADGKTPAEFVALGFAVDKNGTVLADSDRVVQNTPYLAVYNGDKVAPIKVEYQAESIGVAAMKVDTAGTESVTAVTKVSAGSIRLGQTLYALAGSKGDRLLTATVSGFDRSGADTSAKIIAIFAALQISQNDSGTPVFAADGKTVGMAVIKDGSVRVLTFELLNDFLTPRAATEETPPSASVATP